MPAFDRVIGRRIEPLDPGLLHDLAGAARSVLVDVGTGDGRFVVEEARADPECLAIGVDAVADNMERLSRQAAAKPKKGGLPNALFLRGPAEQLPGPLAGLADRLTVNYPWGSLLRIVTAPDPDGLRRLRQVCKAGAALSVLVNYSVFEDRPYLERLGLGEVEDPATAEALPAVYAGAGFVLAERHVFAGDPSARTRWGRQLVRGAARTTLVMEGTASDGTP